MRLSSSLLFLLTSIVLFTAAQIPYAPRLFARSAVRSTQQRSVSGSSLEIEVASLYKRSENDQVERSSDALVGELTARGHYKSCHSDSKCEHYQYCSTKKHVCLAKIKNNKSCSRSAACSSGYCSSSTKKCANKVANKYHCHGDDNACNSGYCSPHSDTCKPKAAHHGGCICDSGCSYGLQCFNGKCEKKQANHTQPKAPSHPIQSPPPQHSGSAWHPRHFEQKA